MPVDPVFNLKKLPLVM